MDARVSTLQFLTRRLLTWLLAVVVTYALATLTATQGVIAELAGMGVVVPLADRAVMSLRDILGMANMFLPMVAFALLVAFMTAALLSRWLSRWRLPLYLLAGAIAVVCIHLGLHLAFGITPVAIARSGFGLLLQALAGAAGGFTYLALVRRQARR